MQSEVSLMAITVSSVLDLAIAAGVLLGMGFSGLWKLRGMIRSDMENITEKHVGPVADLQREMGADLKTLSAKVDGHGTQLQLHEVEIATLKGIQIGRSEVQQAATAVAELITHKEE